MLCCIIESVKRFSPFFLGNNLCQFTFYMFMNVCIKMRINGHVDEYSTLLQPSYCTVATVRVATVASLFCSVVVSVAIIYHI